MRLTEFARVVDASVPTVRGWVQRGVVASVSLGPRRWKRIPRTEVDRLLREAEERRQAVANL